MLLIFGPEASLNRFKYTVLKKSTDVEEVGTWLDLKELAPLPLIEDDEHSIQHTTEAWGTKWNTYSNSIGVTDDSKNELVIYFQTAWSPPDNALLFGSRLFPNLYFVMLYDEPGMAFMGVDYINNGQLLDYLYHEQNDGVEAFQKLQEDDDWDRLFKDEIDAWWELYGSSNELKKHFERIMVIKPDWVKEIPPTTSTYRQYDEMPVEDYLE